MDKIISVSEAEELAIVSFDTGLVCGIVVGIVLTLMILILIDAW
ncbi:hypothetical protein [Photobacterium leiognathi]|nr:hypothetical protein [Photobacterium leiognathi]